MIKNKNISTRIHNNLYKIDIKLNIYSGNFQAEQINRMLFPEDFFSFLAVGRIFVLGRYPQIP